MRFTLSATEVGTWATALNMSHTPQALGFGTYGLVVCVRLSGVAKVFFFCWLLCVGKLLVVFKLSSMCDRHHTIHAPFREWMH